MDIVRICWTNLKVEKGLVYTYFENQHLRSFLLSAPEHRSLALVGKMQQLYREAPSLFELKIIE